MLLPKQALHAISMHDGRPHFHHQVTQLREQRNWHDQNQEAVLQELETSPAGLNELEAERRRAKYGFNRLPDPLKSSAIKRLLLQFHHILIYVLLEHFHPDRT